MIKTIATTFTIFILAIIIGLFVKGFFSLEKLNSVNIYFVKINDDGSKYIAVSRPVAKDQIAFDVAVKELLKGPNETEKKNGIYSEIPTDTKLIEIKNKGKKLIINLSREFEFGGGADSMKRRVNQLIKTTTEAAKNKKVYLELEGEEADVIGGEGIILKQPLDKSL